METRRNPFDLVNAGRSRREPSALGNLSEKLAAIEDRLGMRESRSATTTPYPNTNTAADLDDLRGQLRAELRRAISQEFQALRQRLGSLLEDLDAGRVRDVSTELSRLNKAISDLSSIGESQGINTLHREMAEMKQGIEKLAREETLRETSSRWDNFDQRWSHFERQMNREAESRGANAATLTALQERMETIGKNVAELPQTQSIGALQNEIRSLVTAVREQTDRGFPTGAMDTIEDRLDELSRALVSAQSRPAEIDTSPLERIEARLAKLSKEVRAPEPIDGGDLVRRMESMAERVEALAGRSEAADNAIERIAQQLGALTEHLEKAPPPMDLSPILTAVEERIESVVSSLEHGHRQARDHSEALFRELDAKLEEAGRGGPPAFANEATERALGEIEERLSRITERMNASDKHGEAERQVLLETIDQRFSDLSERMQESLGDVSAAGRQSFEELQNRLSDLSEQVEHGGTGEAGTAQAEAIANLEFQIAELSAFLSREEKGGAAAELAPRLTEIERGLQRSQDEMMEAAKRVVESTLERLRLDGSKSVGDMGGLNEDLRTLEELSRRTEERNARTFEAIHETMLKIVDRLAVIEESRTGTASGAAARARSEAAPATASAGAGRMRLNEAVTPPLGETALGTLAAEPAFAEATAAEDAAFLHEFIDGEQDELLAAEGVESPRDEETLDTDIPGEPMEPGSGVPDLDAVIGKIRAERDDHMGEAEPVSRAGSAKADFVAAARRAAQAAAADAETEISGRHDGSTGRSGLLAKLKRPLMIVAAVILIAIAGIQLYGAFFGGEAEIAREAEPVSMPNNASDPANADEASIAAEEALLANPAETPAEEVTPRDQAARPSDVAANDGTAAAPPAVEAPSAAAEAPAPADTPDDAEPAPSVEAPAADRSVEFGNAAFKQAVADGNPAAWYEAGTRFAEGRGVTADSEMAAEWFRASAEAGYVPAQYRIALSYEKAIGVERDAQAAAEWYRKAADADNASAMHNLGVLHAQGAIGTPDNEQARELFMDAAEYGIRDSQFNLGILNARGIGAPQDLVQSYKWFALAAKNGDTDAADKRDEVAKALKPEQLERARGMVELWKAQPLDPAVNQHLADPTWLNGEKDDTTASVDMKRAIQNIQGILNMQGYDAGAPDGIIGSRTKAAIRKFQADNGLVATGEVDEPLVKTLLAVHAERPVDERSPPAN